MRTDLQSEDLGDFIDQPKCAILATHFPNAPVLLSPVWQEWQDGGFTIFIPADDEKSRHLIAILIRVRPYESLLGARVSRLL